MARRVVLSEFRDERVKDASIEIELSDGSTVTVPPPECWPDKLPRGIVAVAMAVLGDEQWGRYAADGGTAKMLDKIITDAQGATAGESPASTGS